MRSGDAPAAAPLHTGLLQDKVLNRQVDTLYGNHRSSTLADVALAWTLCGLFYWRLGDPMVLAWGVVHLLQTLRYPRLAAYHRDPWAAQRARFWAGRHWRHLAVYSACWGLAPWFFLPAHDLPMTAVLMLVMLSLSSAGVPAMAPRLASLAAFVLPMVTGLIGALLWRGAAVHLFLAAFCLPYLAATLYFGWRQHQLLTQALVTGFEREALAERLAQQIVATQQASEQKTRFFAAASHDLRQPMQAIALLGAALETRLAGQAAGDEARQLNRAVRALSASLDVMLDVSRLEAGVIVPQRRPFELDDMLRALNAMFGSAAQQRAIELRIRASGLWVHSDAQLLQRLLANLVDNAIKYTSRGGVLVAARRRGAQVRIEVIDTGIGVAPEHLPRIFDEFYQVDNPGRDRAHGLGIGLAFVKHLSRLLDHPVQVSSRPGRGSRFRVTVPWTPAGYSVAGIDEPASVHVGVHVGALSARVLLLDDEQAIADAARAFFAAGGLRLDVVGDPADARVALDAAQLGGQPYRLLISDLRLAGGGDGLQAAQALLEGRNPQPALLLLTGETAPAQLRRVRDAGVRVLFKPVEPGALLRAVRAALDAQSTTATGVPIP
ncbi:MAG: response regulator [Burkholderiales bacterium]|nr:response regulator [Burkholderiales bacterium]